MNAAYASTQRGNTHQWGTATSDGIRQTQQTWIAYRDAWTGFAHQKYPGVSSESWRTWLARDRTGLLAKFPQSNPMPPSF